MANSLLWGLYLVLFDLWRTLKLAASHGDGIVELVQHSAGFHTSPPPRNFLVFNKGKYTHVAVRRQETDGVRMRSSRAVPALVVWPGQSTKRLDYCRNKWPYFILIFSCVSDGNWAWRTRLLTHYSRLPHNPCASDMRLYEGDELRGCGKKYIGGVKNARHVRNNL